MSLSYELCIENPCKPFRIDIKPGENRLAFIKSYNEEAIVFLVYNNGIFENLNILRKHLGKHNIEFDTKVHKLDEYTDDSIFESTILFQNSFHNIKLLGYSETEDRHGDAEIRRLYIASHGQIGELTYYSLCSHWYDDSAFISYTESQNDFHINKDLKYYLYEPNNKTNKIIIPKKLTGEKMIEIDEIKDCTIEKEREHLKKGGELSGLDLENAILVFNNDLFISKLYVSDSQFTSVSFEHFINEALNINVERNNIYDR